VTELSSTRPAWERAVIAELPERVRNQIAAGEVVERPASVVKELVENALDAGARSMRIDLEGGGIDLVRVVDDGCGMGPADLALAFAPHATSKLSGVEDLEHIASLGFRGEALASIGAVARARILSRPRGAPTGWSVEDEAGAVGPVREAGGPFGTSVEVRGLFELLPARRRFLKRDATELARCLDVLQRLAIAHVGVGFVVTHGGKRVFDVEAALDRRERIERLFGSDLARSLVAVDGADGSTRLEGFVAPPRLFRADTSRQMWFLNGRAVRDKLLLRALKDAYRGCSLDGRQPVAFLALALDPERVDVNVHPTKSEVRFRDERAIFGFVVSVLRRGVLATDMASPGAGLVDRARARAEPFAPAGAYLPDPGPERARIRPDELVLRPIPSAAPRAGEVAEAPPPDAGWRARDEPDGPFLRVARTYLVRELPDGLEIVDQHALHERVTFEALKTELARGAVAIQRLLVPELVEVSRAELEELVARAPALARIGVLVEAFGPTTAAVHGLPALLASGATERLLRDVLAALERVSGEPSAVELLEEFLHSRACRSSVMAGDELSDDEIRALLRRGAELPEGQTCPHGRPTRVRFTLADLERAFERR
jgi:DNA mismatch repair protein MutL